MKCSTIEGIAQFWRDPFTLITAFIAGLGTANILVRTATYGLTVDGGSTVFLSTALNFLAGEGWRDFTGEPLTLWPPLFPLLVVAGGWVGIEPFAAARFINATAFGLTIFAAGCWLRSNLRSRLLTLVATASIATPLPLNHWTSYAHTEPLFVLLTLLALIQLAAFLNRKTDASLWWAAVFTALAAITRYPGVVLIGTGVLMLLLRRALPLAARLKDAIVFGAVSSLPLAVVLTCNWAVSGTLTGRRSGHDKPSGQSLSDGLSQVANVFREWVILPNAPDGFSYLLSMAVVLVVLAAGAVVVLAGRGLGMGEESPQLGLGLALPFGGFAVIYLVFMVAVVPFTSAEIIDNRYLLPIYVPLLLMAVFLLDRFLSIEAAGWMAAARYGLASLVVLGALAHVGFSARKNLRRTIVGYEVGFPVRALNAAYWQHSETANYIRNNHIEGRLYSSTHITWLFDQTAAPGKHHRIPPGAMGWTEIEAGAHLVWFRQQFRRDVHGYDDTDLRVLPGMETVAELAKTVVFRRTAYEPFDADRHRARKQRYVDQLIQQADEQVARAGWGVYRTGRKLIYRKAPCAPADTQAKFVLHVVPTDPANLPARRKQYDSDNLDFYFDWYGERFDDQCTVIAPLPDYAIDRIYIGQWIAAEDRTLWEAEFPASR